MASAISFRKVVLPALGCETIRALCPNPIGATRSVILIDSTSFFVSSLICLSGCSEVNWSKLTRFLDSSSFISFSFIFFIKSRLWKRSPSFGGRARPSKEGERFHSLLLIKKINEKEMNEEESRKRVNFDQLTSLHPDKQIKLETKKEVLSMRITDLVAPIGFGQRALIVSQPKAGKTTFLKEMAEAISINHPKVKLMAILIGERPEEVTDLKRFVKGEVAASNFDESPRQQVKVANLALERAKRMVEMGEDVIILLDSITRL